LKARFTHHTLSSESFVEAMQAQAKEMARQYSAVLSPDEMIAFLGRDALSLPIMQDVLK
jgi:hypothetical protein